MKSCYNYAPSREITHTHTHTHTPIYTHIHTFIHTNPPNTHTCPVIWGCRTISLSQTIWPRWASRQFVTFPIVQTLPPVTFGYSLSSEAVVMRQLRRRKRLWGRSLTHSHKRTSMEPSRSCWNDTKCALHSEEITSKGTRVSCLYYQ